MKLPDKISSWIESADDKQKIYIFWGIVFLVFVLDYFLVMGPQIRTLTKINPEIKLLAEQLEKTNNDFKRVGQYREEIQRLPERAVR